MNNKSWQGKAIWGAIRKLPLNFSPIFDCSEDDRKTPVNTGSNQMAM
jgi:hypothetical protein